MEWWHFLVSGKLAVGHGLFLAYSLSWNIHTGAQPLDSHPQDPQGPMGAGLGKIGSDKSRIWLAASWSGEDVLEGGVESAVTPPSAAAWLPYLRGATGFGSPWS